MLVKAKKGGVWYGLSLQPGCEVEVPDALVAKGVATGMLCEPEPAKRGPGRPRKAADDENAE